MRLIRAVFLAAAVLVIGAGCGGSAKKAASSAATTTAAVTTTATTTGSASTSSSGTAFASTKNCRQLAEVSTKMSAAMQPANGSAQASIDAEVKQLHALAGAAPSEIRGDFQTFADAFSAYAVAFSKAGLQPGKVSSPGQLTRLAAATKAFSAPKLAAAEQHLSAWAQKNCSGTG